MTEKLKTQIDISDATLESSMNYVEYRSLIDELYERNIVTGHEQKETYLPYTQMNIQRMNRWDKHFEPTEELIEAVKKISTKQTWLIITEGWCGDSAQNLPAVEKISSYNGLIKTKYLLRDDNDAIMQQFLTNGKKSIPKVICFDAAKNILWQWGPRPAGAFEAMEAAKQEGLDATAVKEKLHLWYARDKQQNLQQEFLDLLS